MKEDTITAYKTLNDRLTDMTEAALAEEKRVAQEIVDAHWAVLIPAMENAAINGSVYYRFRIQEFTWYPDPQDPRNAKPVESVAWELFCKRCRQEKLEIKHIGGFVELRWNRPQPGTKR